MSDIELRISPVGSKARLSAFYGEKELDFIDIPLKSITLTSNLTKIDNFCEKHGISLAKYENKPQFLARYIEQNIFNQHDTVEDVINDIEDTQYKKIGVGLHDDKLYYGFKSVPKSKKVEPFVFVVDCDGNLYKEDDIHNNFGIITKGTFFKEVLDRTMTAGAIKTFLLGKGVETAPLPDEEKKLTLLYENKDGLYKQIFNQIEKYIYFRNPEVYHIITCYILLTYIYVYFEAVPRLFLHAEYGSGKTKTMNLIGALCFNPLSSGDPSASSIFRSVESTGGTLLIDDFDRVQPDVKTELDRFWCVGYKKGSSVSRVNTTTWEPESFDVFGCAVMNNIEGLNPVALSRSIEVPLERAIDQPQLNTVLKDNDVVLLELRDRIQLTWMLYAREFQTFIDGFETSSTEFLQGRPQELVFPLEVMMSYFNVEEKDEVIKYVSNSIKSQTSDSSIDDFFAVLIKWIWNRVKDMSDTKETPVNIFISDISFFLIEEEFPYFSREEKPMQKKMLRQMSIKIGSQLAKFPFKKTRLAKGFRYTFILNQVEDIIRSYNYAEYCGLEEKIETESMDKSESDGEAFEKVQEANQQPIEQMDMSDESEETIELKEDKPLSEFTTNVETKPKNKNICQECFKEIGFEFICNDPHTGKPNGKTIIVCSKCLDYLRRDGITGIKKSDLVNFK